MVCWRVSHLDCQVLVEKLLRSTNVKKLLLLIRPKKGVETKLRLASLLESKVFDR